MEDMTLAELSNHVQTKKGEFNLLRGELENKQLSYAEAQSEYEAHIKARWLLSEAQIRTQVRFKEHVEGLVTKAIRAVYPRDFSFILDFDRVRNKLECTPRLKEGDTTFNDIRDCQGGGLVDIIAFSFRLVLWYLGHPRSRNTIILDEPFRFLGEYTAKAGEMLKEVSHKLGVQMVMVTHDDTLAEIADRAFNVTHNGTFSTVKQIGAPELVKAPLVLTRRKK
jgi:hypothetical protein